MIVDQSSAGSQAASASRPDRALERALVAARTADDNRGRDIVIAIGSDDGFKCWLNGKYIGGFGGPRGWRTGETVLKARGRRGKNTLLLEIIEQAGYWAFSARVTDARGVSVLSTSPSTSSIR